MTRIGLFALCASMIFAAGCEPAATPDTGVKPPIASAAEIGRRIERLASDEFEGRAPATPGGQAASQYIANEIKAAGLEPMGENGTYFQSVELTAQTLLPSSTMSISNDDSQVVDGNVLENAVFWTKRLDETVEVKDSEVVFDTRAAY